MIIFSIIIINYSPVGFDNYIVLVNMVDSGINEVDLSMILFESSTAGFYKCMAIVNIMDICNNEFDLIMILFQRLPAGFYKCTALVNIVSICNMTLFQRLPESFVILKFVLFLNYVFCQFISIFLIEFQPLNLLLHDRFKKFIHYLIVKDLLMMSLNYALLHYICALIPLITQFA